MSRNNKITINEITSTLDGEGIETTTKAYSATVWASVEHRNPSEKWADGRMKPEVTDIFTTRYIPGITSAMGITYGSKVYEIMGVEDIRDEHRTLVIQAKEVI